MEQPEVDVVSLHELEGLLDVPEGAVTAAPHALGGNEDVVAAVVHDAPMYCSLQRSGGPYRGAVSMKLTPRSSARSMRGTAMSKLLGSSMALWPPREKMPTL